MKVNIIITIRAVNIISFFLVFSLKITESLVNNLAQNKTILVKFEYFDVFFVIVVIIISSNILKKLIKLFFYLLYFKLF